MTNRRQFLLAGATLGLAGLLPLRLFAAEGDKRLLVLILRGGMDSLSVLAPYADPLYHSLRGELALHDDEMLRLDGTFALHAALKPLLPLWQQGEMLMLPASASAYRERSHFDAQDVLETAATRPHALASGWLNRCVGELSGAHAVAVGGSVPQLLQGPAHCEAWSPTGMPEVDADFLRRASALYHGDPLFAGALDDTADLGGMGEMGAARGPKAFVDLCGAAAKLMSDKARLGSLDLNGWDTHVNQRGRLQNQLGLLAEGVLAFRSGMGGQWRNTAVLALTEFGRTVRPNGSGGSDHGTASLALLFGGGLKGGRWLGEWPGLGKLYQDRDLYPANDQRALVAAVLREHLGLDDGRLARILPGADLQPLRGLFA